jgi:hypothetical protein
MNKYGLTLDNDTMKVRSTCACGNIMDIIVDEQGNIVAFDEGACKPYEEDDTVMIDMIRCSRCFRVYQTEQLEEDNEEEGGVVEEAPVSEAAYVANETQTETPKTEGVAQVGSLITKDASQVKEKKPAEPRYRIL